MSPRVSPKTGVPEGVFHGCLRRPSGPGLGSVQQVSQECTWSVTKVSWTLRNTLGTLFLQTPQPATEPRKPETPKVHFKVRKMPFWTPRKNRPKSQLKCPKALFLDILIPQKRASWTFKLTFEAIFPGGPKWHFLDFKCTFGVSGFQGSVAGRGVCSTL